MSARDPIMLLNMFSGDYAEDHIVHEVINLFQTDDGKNFIYAPSNGKPTKSCENVRKILMLRYLGEGRYEILGRAFIKQCLPTKEDQEAALHHMLYDGQSFKSIMYTAGQPFKEDEWITFEASSCERPQNAIFIDCWRYDLVSEGLQKLRVDERLARRSEDGSQQDIDIVTGVDRNGRLNLLVQHQRRFIGASDSLYKVLDKLFDENSEEFAWADFKKVEDYDPGPLVSDARFLALLNKEESELAYSNMMAYFLDENPLMAKAFIEFLLGKIGISPKPQDLIPYEILREKHHIDILINTHERVFILENKVHAGLSKKDDAGSGKNQLDEYVERVADSYPDKERHVFILCPHFNKLYKVHRGKQIRVEDKPVSIISYAELFSFFSRFDTVRGGKEANRYFHDFLAILKWQKSDHQKDLSRRYLDMSMKRFQRAIEIDKALNPS